MSFALARNSLPIGFSECSAKSVACQLEAANVARIERQRNPALVVRLAMSILVLLQRFGAVVRLV